MARKLYAPALKTTDATTTVLWADPAGARSAYYSIEVYARDTQVGSFGDQHVEIIKASLKANGEPPPDFILTVHQEDVLAVSGGGWAVAAQKNGSTEAFEIAVTGEASHDIEWRAVVTVLPAPAT